MKVLLVEPDGALAGMLSLLLTSEGFTGEQAELGEDAVDLARHYPFDAMVLAGDLPDMTGLEALRKVRAAGVKVPVLMTSFDAGIDVKVATFGAGADDYLAKPFHRDELLARLRALIRRSQGHAQAAIACGPISVDLDAKLARVGERPVHLTGCEFRLLEVLALRKGGTVTKETLLDGIYGGRDEPELKIIDVFVCKIRKKLAARGADVGLSGPACPSRFLETVWGRGYRLTETPEAVRSVKRPSPGRPEGVMRASVLSALNGTALTYAQLSAAVKPNRESSLRGRLAKMKAEGLLANHGGPLAAIYMLTDAGKRAAPKVAA